MLISASPAKSWRVQGVEMGTIPQRDILMEKKKSSSLSQRVTGSAFLFVATVLHLLLALFDR